jgi:phosphohistidine phosphatase
MRLYLVRHGKAEETASSDHERRLTPEGMARMQRAARAIVSLGLRPQYIYSSPRVRARQTAEIIANALNLNVELREEVNYGFNIEALGMLTVGLQYDAEAMFVGHNPSMSQVIHDLTGANVEMKTGSLARVDIAFPAQVLQGSLVWLIAPRVFDLLGH